MTGWALKRFWTTAAAVAAEGGYSIELDGKPVRTPARLPLIVPTLPLAEAVASEWQAQSEKVQPLTMPFTRASNAAIDTVRPNFPAVAETVAAYGGSDLLCYRAEAPKELVQRQAGAWDPLLDWASVTYGADLRVGTGVIHVAQSEEALSRLESAVTSLSPFALTALHDLVSISGSLVIGLAALSDAYDADTLWSASRIDEDWQASLWGTDEEAAANAERRRKDFLSAQVFHRLATAG